MAVILRRAVFNGALSQHSCSNLRLVNLIVEGGFGSDHKDWRCFFLHVCKAVLLISSLHLIAPLISPSWSRNINTPVMPMRLPMLSCHRKVGFTSPVSTGLGGPGAYRALGPLHAGQLHLPFGNRPIAGPEPQRSSHLVDTSWPLQDRLWLHQEPHHLHQVDINPSYCHICGIFRNQSL